MFSINHNIHYKKAWLFFWVMIFCACNNQQKKPLIFTDTINKEKKLPPPPGLNPGNNMPPPPQVAEQIDGLVTGYAANKDDDIDKLLLISGNKNFVFHFPPHTAKKILAIAEKKTVVHISFAEGRKPPKHDDMQFSYELISVQVQTKNDSFNVHDLPPPPPENGKEISININKIQWLNNDKQNGALVVSGRLIALPPHAKESLLPLIQNAHAILIKGYERSAANGFVNMSGLTLVRPYAITIDGINYLIR